MTVLLGRQDSKMECDSMTERDSTMGFFLGNGTLHGLGKLPPLWRGLW